MKHGRLFLLSSKRWIAWSIRLLFILTPFMMVACTTTPQRESPGEFLDSTALTTKVKASLVDELGSSGFSIQVKTFKDEVQLSGFVNDSYVRQRAAVIAAGVNGVKRVRNSILVK